MTKSLGSIAAGGIGLAVIFFIIAVMLSQGNNGRFHLGPKSQSQQGSTQWAWDGGDRLEINTPASVTLMPGGTPTVIVRGDQELVQRLRFAHGRLSGAGDDDCFIPFLCGNDHGNRSVQMELHGVTLKEVRVRGVAQINMGHLDQDRLELRLSGAGKVEGEGRLDELDITISGAGEASFGDLAVDRARVTLSGVGSAEVAPSQEADITISGVGNVRLNTRPARLIQHISGLGNITGPGSKDRNEDDARSEAIPSKPLRHGSNFGAQLGKEISGKVQEKVREKLKTKGLTGPDAPSH